MIHSRPTARRPEPAAIDWLDASEREGVRTALRRRALYRDEDAPGPGCSELVQTHISSVFLTARHVFKFKRPVQLGFADFHTLALRERYCRAELVLNRRLAEGVYLDVLPLCRTATGYELGGRGAVADYCVVMRRLPAERMLDRRLAAGGIADAELEALARLLVDFHRRCDAGPALARYGGLPVLRENWDENFRQTERFVGDLLDAGAWEALRRSGEEWLRRNTALLEARAAGGFIRDGHGDLRCEHVYLGGAGVDGLPAGIKVIDCIEFNERFRYGDVANDLAFLLMDLAALGHPELSRALLERTAALGGDATLARLVPFYACYRAIVRCKVTAFKLDDRTLTGEQRERTRSRAAAFFASARGFARHLAPPTLVLLAGLMGTGKTALAAALATRSGVESHNSDALRKLLAGAAAATGREADFGTGIYTPDWDARTYDALFERAGQALEGGHSAILDASFARRSERERARALAERTGARLRIVECVLDEGSVRERLRRREQGGASVSDGRVALMERQRAAFEPIAGLPAGVHQVLRTERAPEALAMELQARLELPPPLFSTVS